jgi:hypothetical protein
MDYNRTPPREFKPFNEHDWQAFAGCEDDEPLISEADVKVELDGFVYYGVIIIDRSTVAFQLFCEYDLNGFTVEWANVDVDSDYLKEEITIENAFASRSLAICAAGKIPTNVDAEWLFLNGYRII